MSETKVKNGGAKAKRSTGSALVLGAAVCLVYFVTGILGLRFNAVSGFATLVWPPTGIALASLMFLGYGFWPAIVIGAFATNFVTGASVPVALGIAAGNTLEAVIGAYLLKRAGVSPKLDRIKDVLSFIGYAALASTLISATVGVSSLLLGGVIDVGAASPTWIAWWVGDVLGDLIFGAALLVLIANDGRGWSRTYVSREAVALGLTLLAVGALVFAGPFASKPIIYLVLLPLLWAALRFEQVGTVAATFAVMTMAVFATAFGLGPFAGPDLSEGLVFLQVFMGTVAAVNLTAAAVQSERRYALEEVRGLNRDLERLVATRTMQLLSSNESLEKIDESLAERHAVLEAVLHGIGEGIFAVDMAGSTIVFNPAARNIMGIKQEETPKRLEKFFAMFPAYYTDDKTQVPMEDRPVSRALRGERTENEQLIVKPAARPEGVRVSCTGTPIVSEKGQRIGAVVVFREIPR